jgi:hypothetical protein
MIDAKKIKDNTDKYIQQTIDDWVIEASWEFQIDGVVEPEIVKKLILFGSYTVLHDVCDNSLTPNNKRILIIPGEGQCCPKCGEHIGWLGRFFNYFIPNYHKCSD